MPSFKTNNGYQDMKLKIIYNQKLQSDDKFNTSVPKELVRIEILKN